MKTRALLSARLAAIAALCAVAVPATAAEVVLHRVATGDIGVLLIVDALLDGRPTRWLIDSGATHNLVAPRVPASQAEPAETMPMHSSAGSLPATRVVLGDLQLGGAGRRGMNAWRVDLAPVLGPLAAEVDGVLGLPALDGHRVVIDLIAGRVDLDAGEPPDGGRDTAVAVERVRGLPVLTLDIQGQPLKLLLDTGAAGGVVRLQRGFFARPALWRVPQLDLAGVARLQVPLADLPGGALSRALPAEAAGSLGMAVLDGCRFAIDLKRNLFSIERCTAEALPGGFGMLWERSEGALVLSQVWPSSPAGKAGLRAGDRLLSIDGAPAPSGASAGYLALSGRPSVRLDLMRGAERVSATLERAYFLPPLPPR